MIRVNVLLVCHGVCVSAIRSTSTSSTWLHTPASIRWYWCHWTAT